MHATLPILQCFRYISLNETDSTHLVASQYINMCTCNACVHMYTHGV